MRDGRAWLYVKSLAGHLLESKASSHCTFTYRIHPASRQSVLVLTVCQAFPKHYFCSIFYNKPARISQADEDLEVRKVKKCTQGHKVGGRAGISSLGFLAPDHSTWQGSARRSPAFWASREQCREHCRGICPPSPPHTPP